MMHVSFQHLLFHGCIVLLAGIIAGFIFWLAIILRKTVESIRAWRVAHSLLIADGLLLLVAGLAVPHLDLNAQAIRVLAVAFILSGYGFIFAFIIGAWKGIRGLTPKPFGLNTILFIGHFVGATGSFIGIAILTYGLFALLLK